MRLEETKIKTTLKLLMKKQGLQYKDLAQSLGVSTATVKRWLNKGDLGVSELSEISECLGVSLYEVIELSKNEEWTPYLFSEKQEALFANDLSFLLLFRTIIMGLSFSEILNELKLKESELRKKLRHMENVELIKLMPQDRIVLLAKFPFKWRENGALQKAYFTKNIQSLFDHIKSNYRSSTNEPDSGALCKPFEILLSQENRKSFSRDLMEVYTKYMNISRMDLKIKDKNNITVSGLLFSDAFSIWESDKVNHFFL